MSFESYIDELSNKAIKFSRLALQEKILEDGTRRFFSLLSRNKFLSDEIILCLGFAGGGEIALIREYFPRSKIIAVDSKPVYVDMARKRFKDRNVCFYCFEYQKLVDVINKFDYIDAVYWRSLLMHSKDARFSILEARNKIKKKIKFFIEEPDVSTIKTIPYTAEIDLFSRLGVEYGKLRSENFCIGWGLVDILNEVRARFELITSYYPELSLCTRNIFRLLIDDLFPVYKKLGLSTENELNLLRKKIFELIGSKRYSFYFYKMKQVAFCF